MTFATLRAALAHGLLAVLLFGATLAASVQIPEMMIMEDGARV